MGAGEIEALFTTVTRSREVTQGQSFLMFFDAPFAALFLLFVWFLGGPVALVPVAVVSVISLSALWVAQQNRYAVADRSAARANHSSLLINGFAQIELFRVQGYAGELMARLRQTGLSALDATERAERDTGTLMDLTQVSSVATSVGVLGAGSLMVLDGGMTVGSLAACLILGQRAVSGLIGVMSGVARRQAATAAYHVLQRAISAGRSIDPLIARPLEPEVQAPLGLEWKAPDGRRIEARPGTLSTVTFATFDDTDAAYSALGDALLSLATTPDGKGAAIKLTRDTPDPEGVKDNPHASKASGELIPRVAMVRAMPTLFRGTILENITGFDPGRIDAAVAIAHALGLERSVARISAGFGAQVGATFGSPCSSGAIKRIGLVRAFAGSPGLVILNNPAYALDKDGTDRLLAFLPTALPATTVIVLTCTGARDGFADAQDTHQVRAGLPGTVAA
jgi:ABC-type protease/lipase transport system fused ATPase/permease subunit